MKITKNQFVACIEAMKRHHEFINRIYSGLKAMDAEWQPDDGFEVYDALSDLVHELTQCKKNEKYKISEISYFCEECNFGETGAIGSSEQLYDLLIIQSK